MPREINHGDANVEYDPLTFDQPRFRYTPKAFAESSRVPDARARRELQAFGLNPETVGKQPDEIDAQSLYRYQYDVVYVYPRRVSGDENEYYPVEFRTYIYTTEPLPDAAKRHIKSRDNPRLQRAFDSGPYGRGQIRGFGFIDKQTFVEEDEVALDEANNIGVPQFEVLIVKDDAIQGHAGGFFDPFGIFRAVPSNEEWNITKNPSRDEYEFRPQSNALKRLEGQRKQVYLNGKFIGNLSPSRGSVALKTEYGTKDGTYKDSETGQQMHSRQKLIDEGLFHPNAIAEDGKVYKVDETDDKIFLVATKPDDFEPTPADEVPTTAGEQATLGWSEGTTFDIRHDDGPLMGEYDAPTRRTITDGTEMML